MEVTRIKQTRIYEKVVDVFKKNIADGGLPPGAPLPPERQLMEDMGVSRNTLREAFRVLELLGMIESIPGKGRFVRGKDSLSLDAQSVPLDRISIMEYMNVRRVIDPAISAEAARHALAPHLEKISSIIDKSWSMIDDPIRRAHANFSFHVALAEATQNSLFVNITKVCFYSRSQLMDELTYRIMKDRGLFIKEHQKIYEAVCGHDADLAELEAQRHVERIYEALEEELSRNRPKG